jgi:hypothetical protein
LDDITDGIWAICEETFWGIPASIGFQSAGNTLADSDEPVVELFAAETANLLARTLVLLDDRLDRVSPVIRPRIKSEIERRILAPLRVRTDFWWLGFTPRPGRVRVNNWNPWIVSNWLVCVLLLETDPIARAESVHRIMQVVDAFIDSHPSDGGCDEGPSYWSHAGASLYEVLELLHHASSGAISVFSEPLIGDIGRYIFRAHVADDFYLNFADAPAVTIPDAAIVHAYGTMIGDTSMQEFGRWIEARHGGEFLAERDSVYKARRVSYLRRPLRRLFGSLAAELASRRMSAASDEPRTPMPRDVWLDKIEVMVARDHDGRADGFFLGAKGGHNAESHNHNDVGSFVVYLDGTPLVVDAGVETYTAKTFSEKRYEIWTMQSAFHSLLPCINGIQQAAGAQYASRTVSYQADDERASLSLDIATAYPEEAGVVSWLRTITLDRSDSVVIADEWELNRGGATVEVSFLSPADITPDPSNAAGALLSARAFGPGYRSASGRIACEGQDPELHVEWIPTTDERLGGVWGEGLNRGVFIFPSVGESGTVCYRVTRT